MCALQPKDTSLAGVLPRRSETTFFY